MINKKIKHRYVVCTGKRISDCRLVAIPGRSRALRAAGLPTNLRLATADESRLGVRLSIREARIEISEMDARRANEAREELQNLAGGINLLAYQIVCDAYHEALYRKT